MANIILILLATFWNSNQDIHPKVYLMRNFLMTVLSTIIAYYWLSCSVCRTFRTGIAVFDRRFVFYGTRLFVYLFDDSGGESKRRSGELLRNSGIVSTMRFPSTVWVYTCRVTLFNPTDILFQRNEYWKWCSLWNIVARRFGRKRRL